MKLRLILCLALVVACDCDDDDDRPDDVMDAPFDMGGGADAGPDMGEGDSLEAFAADYARAYCAKLDQCFGPAAGELSFPDCERSVEAEMVDALLPAWRLSEAEGNLTIDRSRADECLEALAVSVTCANLNTFIAPGCVNFLQAGSTTGGACRTEQDCPLGDYCDTGVACPGVCTTFAAVGESCTERQCAPDAFCNEVSECEALPQLGEACDLDIACIGLLYCASDADGIPSCRAVDQVFTVAEGDPCLLSASGPYCQAGLSCAVAGDGFVCQPLVGSGEACTVGFPDPCPEGEACDAPDGITGTCTAAAGEGESCAERPCGPGLACGTETSTCVSLSRIGESCAEDLECASVLCEEGVCISPGCTS